MELRWDTTQLSGTSYQRFALLGTAFVVDGETGFLVDRGNLVVLRIRLQQLLVDPELRKKMGEAGRRRYLEHFTAERMLEATLRVYKEVLKEHLSMGA